MGVSETAVQEAVEEVVSYMDKNGTLVAPRRLLYGRRLVEESLLSLQVFTLADSSVTFSHQVYLDHQLAYLLLRRIDEGKTTVEEWLTGVHQGLFRREQLRLVLGLLREERNDRYSVILQSLLASPKVRFHLKQVVLQFLGQVDEPRPAEIELVSSLFEEDQWQEHVIADVYYSHPQWIDSACFLADWLEGEDWKRDQALRVIHSVSVELGDWCSRLLAPRVDRGGDWTRWVASILHGDPAKDSAELFALRVRLAEMGAGFSYLDWKALEGPRLDRLVQLLRAVLFGLRGERANSQRSSSLLYGFDKVDFSEAPLEVLSSAWTGLLPAAAEVLAPAGFTRVELSLVAPSADWRFPLRELLRHLVGELMARDPLWTIDFAEQGKVPVGELLLLEALSRVDDTRIADRALAWLMSSPSRLRLRWYNSDLPWQASRNAVEKLTRVCSPGLCATFELFLIGFQEPRLRKDMQWRHQDLLFPPEGQPRFHSSVLMRPSVAGETAYHLLPCLPAERLFDLGRRRLLELQRKFALVDEIFFSGQGRIQGGTVGSPLPQERLNQLSDSTWLRIIANNQILRPGAWHRRYRDGRFEKSTPETLAYDLQTATAREPRRFARLAVRFPANSNPLYFGAVLHGLYADVKNVDNREDVTLEELEALLSLPIIISEPSLAMSVARLIDRRPELDWSPSTLRLLGSIATDNPDPAVGELHMYGGNREDWGPENLVNNALNCTRGAATFALAKLLFSDKERLPLLAETIEHLTLDPHPAVRAAVFECCLAILRVTAERSIAWALQAAKGHEALLACSKFERFLLFASRNHPADMEATIQRMLSSGREDVVRVAARHATALHLLFGRMEKEAENCIRGTTARRVGAAQVAAAFADSPEHHSRAQAILTELMNDDEDEVLEACAEALRDTTLDQFADSPEFLNTYAASRAFQRHPLILLHRLKEHPGSLISFAACILEICRSLASAGRAQRDKSFWEVDYYLPPVLLRLYEQAPQGSQVREQSLDAWDLLLGARVASALSLTKKWEIEE